MLEVLKLQSKSLPWGTFFVLPPVSKGVPSCHSKPPLHSHTHQRLHCTTHPSNQMIASHSMCWSKYDWLNKEMNPTNNILQGNPTHDIFQGNTAPLPTITWVCYVITNCKESTILWLMVLFKGEIISNYMINSIYNNNSLQWIINLPPSPNYQFFSRGSQLFSQQNHKEL